MDTQKKLSLGSALAAIAGAGIALSAILGWTSLVRPWGFLVGFVLGVAAGAGVALAITGLLEHRRSK
jgi:predicted ABC-type sugar transport system permease subunit